MHSKYILPILLQGVDKVLRKRIRRALIASGHLHKSLNVRKKKIKRGAPCRKGRRYVGCLNIGWFTIVAAAVSACSGGGDQAATASPPPPLPPPPIARFSDATDASGIEFTVGFSENAGDVRDIGYFSGGVAAADYDADGDTDLFIVRGDIGPNLLYRNDGNNRFTDVAASAGLANTRSMTENYRHSGPMFADMDGDGAPDLFIGGVQGDPSQLFKNNGDGTFTNVTAGSGIDSMTAAQTVSAAFGDYDLDGDLDLLLAHWGTPRSHQNPGDTEHLWRNESNASGIRFASVSIESGVSPSMINLPDPRAVPVDTDHTFAPAFVRLDDDLYPDIVMAADFNTSQIMMNNGDGTFRNVTDVDVITETNGMGSALGDYDNDGDIDWFVTSIYRAGGGAVPNGNRLYRNEGGAFTDVTDSAGVADGSWGWAASFLDLNNDGHLDIYHTNGWPFDLNGDFNTDTSRAFVADGNGFFTDQANTLGMLDSKQGRGVVCADFDSDGDVDIFLWSSDASNGASLFRNDTNDGNYLTVSLRGLPPNTAASGARVHATVGGITQMREISIGSNFVSQNDTTLHFGLAAAPQVDALQIEWPDGAQSDLGIVSANQQLLILHPGL